MSTLCVDQEGLQAWQAGALDFTCGLPDASVDLLLTDPPYWTLDEWRKMGTTARLGGHHNPEKRREERWFPTLQPSELLVVLQEAYRVLKPDRHAYVLCDFRVYPVLHQWVETGQLPFNYIKPLIWNKLNVGMGYHYRAQYEFVVMLEKGHCKLNDLTVPDVLSFKRVMNGYPTEKPLGLFKLLIEQSTQVGQLVFDPFAGSGTTGAAALTCQRSAWLVDIHDAAIETMKNRFASSVFF